jgi:hypothetical protein
MGIQWQILFSANQVIAKEILSFQIIIYTVNYAGPSVLWVVLMIFHLCHAGSDVYLDYAAAGCRC